MTERQNVGEPRIRLGAKLTAAALAGLLTFALCEGASRMLLPAPPAPNRSPQVLYQSDRNVGFLHAPNQAGWVEDGWATINAFGLRGPAPQVPKAAGSVRVLAVGDSTTFGWGVGDHETYPDALEQLLRSAFPARRPHVVNGGISAYDLDHDARLLQHFAPILHPDIVLVGLFWNDLPYERVSPEGVPQADASPASGAPAAVSASQGPVGDTVTSAAPKPFRMGNEPSRMNRWLRSSRLLYAARQTYMSAISSTDAASNQVRWEMALLEGRRSPAIDQAWNAIGTTLQQIKGIANEQGFAVGVVIMPIRAQVEGNYPRAEYQSRVKAMAEPLGFFVIDPLPRLREHARENLFIPYDRMHFSPGGNALMAREAFEALQHRPEFHEAE